MPQHLSLGRNQALLHSSRLATAGEAAGPRSELALLSGGTVAGAYGQARETQQAFYPSTVYSLLSASALLFRCLENPESWDQEMSCTKYACPWPVTEFIPKSLERGGDTHGFSARRRRHWTFVPCGGTISFLQVQFAF